MTHEYMRIHVFCQSPPFDDIIDLVNVSVWIIHFRRYLCFTGFLFDFGLLLTPCRRSTFHIILCITPEIWVWYQGFRFWITQMLAQFSIFWSDRWIDVIVASGFASKHVEIIWKVNFPFCQHPPNSWVSPQVWIHIGNPQLWRSKTCFPVSVFSLHPSIEFHWYLCPAMIYPLYP